MSDPPGPVTSFSATLLPHSNDVQITWQTPENLTVAVVGYVVTYQVVGVGDCNDTHNTSETSLRQLPDDAVSYTLRGLTPWLKYRVSVQAVNIAGSGQRSSSDVIMPGSG